MARSVPKCKRAAYVYDRDFIVVDDISGVLKMRSECAIDGYGFLSSQGDIRNPQEIPPIINEQMAAWPDPRPIGQNIFTPSPDYQYFLFNYFVSSVNDESTTFDATASVGFNAPIASMAWSVDGVYVVSGLVPVVTMTQGLHDISVLLTDLYGNEQTFTFEYNQPVYLGFDFIGGINTDSDPFFSNVISLLHFNGLEGSQDIVDEIGNIWNIYAQIGADPFAGIELAQHGIDPAFVTNFNTAEYFSSSKINMDSGLDFFMLDSTNGDCTVEWFFKYSPNATGWLLFSSAGDYPTSITGGFRVALQSGQIAILGEYQAPAEDGYNMPSLTVSLDFIPHSLWHHIALVISGSALKCFINGVLRDSATIQRAAGFNYTTGETIIRLSDIANGMANNSIATDEFRITTGVARYSSSFARPIKQFPDHG